MSASAAACSGEESHFFTKILLHLNGSGYLNSSINNILYCLVIVLINSKCVYEPF